MCAHEAHALMYGSIAECLKKRDKENFHVQVERGVGNVTKDMSQLWLVFSGGKWA